VAGTGDAAAPGDGAAALPTVAEAPEVLFPAAVVWAAPGGESSAGSVVGSLRITRTRAHFTLQHLLLCHMVLY